MLELHRHNILSLGTLSGSYLNRAVKSSIPLPLARTVNVLARPSTSFLFSTIRRSSFKLNRKMDADEDGPIEVGDRSQQLRAGHATNETLHKMPPPINANGPIWLICAASHACNF